MTDVHATYRLQLGPQCTFTDALALVPYLRDLGVSHLYLSPIWQARHGSTHGYDVTDPACISEDLGGEEQFVRLADAGLGIVLDVVPNHMVADDANPYWSNPQLRSQFFDIDPASGFHRRFFDVNDLVGVRVEDPDVFEVVHSKVRSLIDEGLVDGLRIDHIDGLADPATYLDRLALLGPKYVWVEKILTSHERLRSWPVKGTTGYDFLNDLTALFIDPDAEEVLTGLAGEPRSFAMVAEEAKLEQVANAFAPEVRKLREVFDVAEVDEALASLPVYRTYVNPTSHSLEDADRVAIFFLPEPVRSAMTLDTPVPDEFIVRFQQTSGAVMAKGVEDTAFYRYVRLHALNEVGGNPQRFSLSVAAFHLANEQRQQRFPRAMLASQTHDTKRSGDVRARLIALSYRAEQWSQAVQEWHEITGSFRAADAPDWTEELFIYQTLLGGWPITMDRLGPYVQKALREAKRNTNWIAPNQRWETEVLRFCERLCSREEFLQSFEPFAQQVALMGERISLAQLALRLSSPGVPDLYQGDETWNFSFVDPDNRRSVDWTAIRDAFEQLRTGAVLTRANAKLFVTTTLLDLRRRQLNSFHGDYQQLSSSPSTCAYQRGDNVVVIVGVREKPIDAELPRGQWSNVLAPLDQLYPVSGIAVYERTG